jgi:hypothetical protein
MNKWVEKWKPTLGGWVGVSFQRKNRRVNVGYMDPSMGGSQKLKQTGAEYNF